MKHFHNINFKKGEKRSTMESIILKYFFVY